MIDPTGQLLWIRRPPSPIRRRQHREIWKTTSRQFFVPQRHSALYHACQATILAATVGSPGIVSPPPFLPPAHPEVGSRIATDAPGWRSYLFQPSSRPSCSHVSERPRPDDCGVYDRSYAALSRLVEAGKRMLHMPGHVHPRGAVRNIAPAPATVVQYSTVARPAQQPR